MLLTTIRAYTFSSLFSMLHFHIAYNTPVSAKILHKHYLSCVLQSSQEKVGDKQIVFIYRKCVSSDMCVSCGSEEETLTFILGSLPLVCKRVNAVVQYCVKLCISHHLFNKKQKLFTPRSKLSQLESITALASTLIL